MISEQEAIESAVTNGTYESQYNMGEATQMTWEKPRFEEILLNCEINSYAPAEL